MSSPSSKTDNVEASKEEVKLSAAQRARIERNRQKALLLRQSRLAARPYPPLSEDRKGTAEVKKPIKVIDSGAGFLIEEDPNEVPVTVELVHPAGAVLETGGDKLHCSECCREFQDSYLFHHFELSICDNCRDGDGKHKLITRTEAKDKYMLKDCDLDKREPVLKFILKKNPRNSRWGDMKLYLQSAVEERAMEVWGSEDGIEEAKQKRLDNKEKMKQKKFDKKVKELRMSVRSSLWTKDLGNHEHEYGEETYNEEEDTYSKTCKTCNHTMSYEKM